MPPAAGTDDAASAPPIAMFVFNRPETTARVFARVAEARPPRLFLVADGPRADRPHEEERCRETRAIVERVDWPCEVLTNYADANLGCRRRIASGLDWIFSFAERAIILEDDCLPDPTFFRYCRELLERYKDDERVVMISGDNFGPSSRTSPYSYYYSKYPHVWGWATWRRAWRLYDVSMALWPSVRDENLLEEIVGSERAALAWRDIFDAVHSGQIDTWDYQLTFACWMQNGLSILPNVNLVSNIGFTRDATHTTTAGPLSNLPTYSMPFPLRHPPYMVRDRAADAHTESIFGTPDLFTRARNKLRRLAARTPRASSDS
jgi:hypothetical protein